MAFDAVHEFLSQVRTRGLQLAVRRGAVTSNELTEQLKRALLEGVVPERIRNDDDNRIADPSDAAAGALALALLREASERGQPATDVVERSAIFGDDVAVALAETFLSLDRLKHALGRRIDRGSMPRYSFKKEAGANEKAFASLAQELENSDPEPRPSLPPVPVDGDDRLTLHATPLPAVPVDGGDVTLHATPLPPVTLDGESELDEPVAHGAAAEEFAPDHPEGTEPVKPKLLASTPLDDDVRVLGQPLVVSDDAEPPALSTLDLIARLPSTIPPEVIAKLRQKAQGL